MCRSGCLPPAVRFDIVSSVIRTKEKPAMSLSIVEIAGDEGDSAVERSGWPAGAVKRIVAVKNQTRHAAPAATEEVKSRCGLQSRADDKTDQRLPVLNC
jgi:hypothetical protein